MKPVDPYLWLLVLNVHRNSPQTVLHGMMLVLAWKTFLDFIYGFCSLSSFYMRVCATLQTEEEQLWAQTHTHTHTHTHTAASSFDGPLKPIPGVTTREVKLSILLSQCWWKLMMRYWRDTSRRSAGAQMKDGENRRGGGEKFITRFRPCPATSPLRKWLEKQLFGPLGNRVMCWLSEHLAANSHSWSQNSLLVRCAEVRSQCGAHLCSHRLRPSGTLTDLCCV